MPDDDQTVDPERLQKTAHERKRDLRARDTWFGIVEAPECTCCKPTDEARACKLAEVTFTTKTDKLKKAVAILRRYSSTGKPPVLLVHGATAWRGTFMEPDGGIIHYLLDTFDVWTLDWRASKLITDLWKDEKTLQKVPCALRNGTLDDVIEGELRAAVKFVFEQSKSMAPRLVGHCIGAALIAAAIARGALAFHRDDQRAALIQQHVVLSTIGLFYRGSVDTWLRAQERLDLNTFQTWRLGFDEPTDWPEDYERVFKLWESTPYPHCKIPFCRRISTLFGAPYRPNDIGDIHGSNGMLEEQFGVIPLSMLNHIARNVRRGWSGKFATTDRDGSDLNDAKRFDNLKVTMIGGQENQLWHRDSLDRMYEWLRRANNKEVKLKVFPNYGHQDLWWSRRSSMPGGVYQKVKEALDPCQPPRRQ